MESLHRRRRLSWAALRNLVNQRVSIHAGPARTVPNGVEHRGAAHHSPTRRQLALDAYGRGCCDHPADELPKVEVGIILLNADRNLDARQHLEDMARDKDNISAHLSFNLGVARFTCGAYPEAMDALDTSISQCNDYGPALDLAAQCAFAIGETKKARDLAKRAKRHGHTEAYDNWRAGLYRKKK